MTMQSVLVVDDEPDTLNLLKMILEISGYEAYTTLNSMDALTMAQVEQPDVVLLDVMMPKMDGFQLCKLLRAHPATRELPIIFVTAYSALDIEDRRKESGGDMVIPKPVSMDNLIAAIEKVQTLERNMPTPVARPSNPVNTVPSSPAAEAKPSPPAAPAVEAPKTPSTGAGSVQPELKLPQVKSATASASQLLH